MEILMNHAEMKVVDDFIAKRNTEELMEEMANAPKEEMGKREPGERCMYEMKFEEYGRFSNLEREFKSLFTPEEWVEYLKEELNRYG